VITSPARRVLLCLTSVAALVLGVGLPAAGAAPAPNPTAQLSDLQADHGKLRLLLSVTGLPVASTVDLSSLRLTAGGKLLTAHASTRAASGGTAVPNAPAPRTRQAMLVLDVSGSMQGSRLTAARAAALSYALALPADVQVGLVTFSGRPSLVLAPTPDRAALRAALSRVSVSGDTALYDAALAAKAAFGKPDATSQRRMLILSDGADTSSSHPLATVTSALKGSGIGVDAVGIELTGDQRKVLQQITAAGAGQLLSSSGLDQLPAAFVRAAQTFSQQVDVTADLPSGLAGHRISVVATLRAGNRELRAAATVQIPAPIPASGPSGAAAAATRGAALPVAGPPPALMALIFLALLGVGLLLVWNPKPKPAAQQRLEQLHSYAWSPPVVGPPIAAPAEGQLATAALSFVDRFLRSRGSRSRIQTELERAGLRMRPQEWILLRISIGIALIAVLVLLTGSLLIGVLAGSALAWLATRLVLSFKASRRCAAFADQLPDVLQLIASSLRSGFSLSQAIDGVVREGPQPAATEFARAVTEARLGVDQEEALDWVAERMKCQDLSWVVMAVRISREVGGNLAEVLLTTVHTMRARAQLKRQIRALSAEGRLSAYVLIALPVFVAGWFLLVRPQYLRPLYTSPGGIAMLVVAVTGLIVGSWWMSRVVKVEV
jgi:tight adherence protein B